MSDQDTYITLKEAAKLSGYSSDYVGQLIRSGKLPGKQIYSNVAWVTTKAALNEYMQLRNAGGEHVAVGGAVSEKVRKARNALVLKFGTDRLMKMLMYAVIGLCAVFMLILFYIFSVSFDRTLQQRALEKQTAEHEQIR